jgi:hypothetical protein
VSPFSAKTFTMVALVAALSVVAVSQTDAQAKLVPASTTSPSNQAPSQSAPLHDAMPSRLISAHIRDGILTVDGMVAKVELNYDIEHTGYMYFFVPGVGTAVVSMSPIADAEKVPNAFDGSTLAFKVDGHTFELSSENNMLSKRKDKAKADVYVRLDKSTVAVSRYPQMGFGDTTQSPYVWPLSAPEPKSKEKAGYVVPPPPMPASVLPRTVDTASTATPSNH